MRDSRESLKELLASLPVPLAVTGILWATSANVVTATQGVISFLLALIAWMSARRWAHLSRREVPLFPLIATAYWVAYGLPLFWGDPALSGTFGLRYPSDQARTLALLMALAGVSALALGMRVGTGWLYVPETTLVARRIGTSRWYLYILVLIGTVLNMFAGSAYFFGEGMRQTVLILSNTVPIVAFCMLFRSYLRGEHHQLDGIAIALFCVSRAVAGLSSGWLGTAATLIVIVLVMLWQAGRRFRVLPMVLLAGFILFFQVSKEDFRRQYWYSSYESTMLERVVYWIQGSSTIWQEAFTDPNGDTARELAYKSLRRFDLLPQAANVIELTPSVVPYQYGRLYSYLWVSLVPRVLWANKPSISEANRFYQVEYGLTAERDLEGVSIAVGVLAEAYISFGWFGVIGIMFLIGLLLDTFRRVFLAPNAGDFLNCLGLAMLPTLIVVESQMAVYVGGTVQTVVLTMLAFFPVLSFIKRDQVTAKTAFSLRSTMVPREVALAATRNSRTPAPSPSVR
jgi:hypothetical protein